MSLAYAYKLYIAGRSHRMAAFRLWEWAKIEGEDDHPEDPNTFVFNGPLSLSINHLAGLSLELFLKAAYVANGGEASDKHLRVTIGHKLERALAKAEEQGFETDAPHLAEIVRHLSEPYAKHFFRYQWPDEFPLPEFKQVADALTALEEDVKALCMPDGMERLQTTWRKPRRPLRRSLRVRPHKRRDRGLRRQTQLGVVPVRPATPALYAFSASDTAEPHSRVSSSRVA